MGPTLFETIELHDGRPVALHRHLDRLEAGARQLRVDPPDRITIVAAAAEVVAAWGRAPGRLRITLRGGPDARTTLHAAPMTVRTDPVDVVVSSSVHDERSATSGLKTADGVQRVAALHHAALVGAEEALFANRRGELCEGATSNVVVHLDGQWCTPPLDSGCLPGITRALLLECSRGGPDEVVERTVTMVELAEATELLLVSTGRHLQPVRSVSGRTSTRVDSASTRRLRERLRRHRLDLGEP